MLRFAFPYSIYAERENAGTAPVNPGDNLRDIMGGRDIWSDTVKNFSTSWASVLTFILPLLYTVGMKNMSTTDGCVGPC